jgi:hypothetical protein
VQESLRFPFRRRVRCGFVKASASGKWTRGVNAAADGVDDAKLGGDLHAAAGFGVEAGVEDVARLF